MKKADTVLRQLESPHVDIVSTTDYTSRTQFYYASQNVVLILICFRKFSIVLY